MGGDRPSFQLDKEIRDRSRKAFGFAFDLAIPGVAYPAGKTQTLCAPLGEGAKTHALDVAGNQETDAA